MQFGTPVFLSNKSALPEVGGKHAFYWEHFDAKYMAEIIIKQLNIFNNSRYKNEQKLKDYAGQYSWDKTAKNYLEVYKSLIFK
jgi:glycosyltransferase involved in cell wall biosynthesis